MVRRRCYPSKSSLQHYVKQFCKQAPKFVMLVLKYAHLTVLNCSTLYFVGSSTGIVARVQPRKFCIWPLLVPYLWLFSIHENS